MTPYYKKFSNRDKIILGNPGIGKTFFGYYLLLYFISQHKTVLYEDKDDTAYKFSTEGVYEGKIDQFWGELSNENNIYIVDGKKPLENVNAKAILVTSPKKSIWHSFAKVNAAIYYMPIWSYDEIEKCRGLVFDTVEKEKAQELFDKWGGIPRYVLSLAHEPTQQNLLDNTISTADTTKITDAINEKEASDDTPHMIIHMEVKRSIPAVI